MCGISGVVFCSASINNEQIITAMTDIIYHRGPDNEGHFFSSDLTVAFGHRRLSILDLSDAGIQPMTYFELTITYNGEIYNYVELREELQSKGFHFNTRTDTEVILAAYSHWGAKCVNKFNGMWAFAIYDEKKKQVFCSRDRFGIKPFYYTWVNGQFYFASEIKCFTVVPGWKAELNFSRAYDFINSGYLSHTPETLFKGVNELRGGSNIFIDLDKKDIKESKYFDSKLIAEDHNNGKTEKESISHFKELLSDAVRIALRSDVKVGSALSGGLDSSAIVAIANRHLKSTGDQGLQECVSACYSDVDVDESFYIDALASEIDINVHKVYPSWEGFLKSLDHMVWHQDEPIPTMSIFAQYCVFQSAAENNIKVMMDGQGADEILAGYESFYRPYFLEQIRKKPLAVFPALVNYIIKHKKYPFKAIINKFKAAPFKIAYSPDFLKNTIPFTRPTDESIKDASDNHLQGFGLHSLLRYEDRNSMAFSIESRVPFLDFRLVEMALSLNNNLKIKNGVRKYILREAFKDLLPKAIYQRYDKLGFPTPQERWTSENAELVNNLFTEAVMSLPQIFSADVLNISFERLKKGEKEFVFFVWRVINFHKWVNRFEVSIN